jgi:hypothetical protein
VCVWCVCVTIYICHQESVHELRWVHKELKRDPPYNLIDHYIPLKPTLL